MIAEAIAQYIKENNIKQVSLCEKAGLTRHRVGFALRGKRRLSLDEYEKICTALNVPFEYFFNHQQLQCSKTDSE